jgi:uncharacterized membrane protein
VSDLLYSALLAAGIVLIALRGATATELPYAILLVSAAVSLLPFGRQYLISQFCRIYPRELFHYADVWRRHSRWSLSGVVTTEATVNAHAYIVTYVSGPLAFAPIAASALIIRPVNVVLSALTEFERPQMARQISAGQIEAATKSSGAFLLILIAVWIVTAIAGVVLIYSWPELIFPSSYSYSYLTTGAVLWMAVMGMRLLRTPESVLLQSAGMFRPLAHASFVSSGVSVVGVAALLWMYGPLWSIGGVLLGETVFAAWTLYQGRRWRTSVRENAVLSGSGAL